MKDIVGLALIALIVTSWLASSGQASADGGYSPLPTPDGATPVPVIEKPGLQPQRPSSPTEQAAKQHSHHERSPQLLLIEVAPIVVEPTLEAGQVWLDGKVVWVWQEILPDRCLPMQVEVTE
jgi:hypothetical protein